MRLALVDHQLATIEPKTGKAALFGVHVPGLAVMAQNAPLGDALALPKTTPNRRGPTGIFKRLHVLCKPQLEVPLFL